MRDGAIARYAKRRADDVAMSCAMLMDACFARQLPLRLLLIRFQMPLRDAALPC